ncbi:MAG: hypothetical protein GWP63_20200 [Haliea sp.]|nr:hypothetical protein [Haliea sp.]
MVARKPVTGLLLTLCLYSIAAMARADAPLRALLLTSPGIYHDYQFQSRAIGEGIAARANVTFDISLAEHARWKTTDYAKGYDVVIYNICMANNTDRALIANMRRQTEELSVPAMVIHCAMHSFRNTNDWWPLHGLQSKSHEPLGRMKLTAAEEHPVLSGIPADWTVSEDELYINLQFRAQPLLTSVGEDDGIHVTAWIKQQGDTPVFGTTLGHSDATMEDPVFQQLLTNALLYITGNLTDDGTPNPALAPNPSRGEAIASFSAPPGVAYLDPEQVDCVMSEIRNTIGFCYVGCIVNPLLWGEEADACKGDCEARIPPTAELAAACRNDQGG